MDISCEAVLIVGFAVQRLVDSVLQLGEVVWAKLDQVMLFRVGPQRFDGIELRGVGGKVFDVQVGRASQILSHKRGLVSFQMIPQENDRPAEMTPQLLQHGDDHRLVDHAVRPEKMVATQFMPSRRDADHPDDRNLLMMLELMPQQRRVSSRRPGPLDRGKRQKARFVPENDYCALAMRFFLMRGQSHARQRAISASFRSRARHSGFCGVKSSAFKNVGTYLT